MRVKIGVLTACVGLFTPCAWGGLVEIRFEGEIFSILGETTVPELMDVAVRDPLVISVVYDEDTPDLDDSLSNGRYAFESVTVSVGSFVDSTTTGFILVFNNSLIDDFEVEFEGHANNGLGFGLARLAGTGALNDTNDSIPTDLDLGGFSGGGFSIELGGLLIKGPFTQVTSLPIPAPPGIATMILVGCFPARRRRRRLNHAKS